jgi:hypothetical protein
MAKKATDKNWIQNAVNPAKKGLLRKELSAKPGKPIPEKKLEAAAKKGGKIGQRARFAENVRGLK